MLNVDFARHRQASRRRLLLLLLGFGLVAMLIVARLAQLQILRFDEHRLALQRWLDMPDQYLPALRGDVVDRHGTVLAQDVPVWQVKELYGAMHYDPEARSGYIQARARRLIGDDRPFPPGTERRLAEQAVVDEIDQARRRVAELAGVPLDEVLQAESRVVARISRLRQWLAKRRGYDERISEEDHYHPIVTDVPPDVAIRMRKEFADRYAWLRIETAPDRRYLDEPCLPHLLGRLGAVGPEHLEQDEHADDDMLRLDQSERIGISGVERLAQDLLRGRRGRISRDRNGERIERIEPVKGQTVALSIDVNLQRWIYDRLGRAVLGDPLNGIEANATAAGAAAVVLDVQTREVLALVSWPGYTREQMARGYEQLAADTIRLPTLFKAVQAAYAPGSIVKPITVLAALGSDVIGPYDTIECAGQLTPGVDAWRCWTYWRGMAPHGPLSAEQALQHSCNIYCYTVGRRLGVDRLTHWMGLLGLGRDPGVGLVEAVDGVLPTSDWLRRNRRRQATISDAQNFSIGQGEILLTPLQAANLGATVATGTWRPATLLRGRPSGPAQPLPGSPLHWQLVRQGLFRVVNDPRGTAYRYARSEKVAIAGKTGTAEASGRPYLWTYEIKMKDGSVISRDFPSPSAARQAVAAMPEAASLGARKAHLWPHLPPDSGRPTHAWFMGFAPADNPQIAVAVLIEYGGSGGRAAGPVARDIIEYCLGFEPTPPHMTFDTAFEDVGD